MEGLTRFTTILKDLRRQVEEMTSAGLSLVKLLADEANLMNRKDDISRLEASRSTILEQLNQAKRSEDTAKSGYTKGRLVISLTGLAVGGIIRLASRDERVRAFSGHILDNLGGEELPFGTVLICVGPRGLPDDMRVVCVSRLARESKRVESEVIDELKRRGHLLTNEYGLSPLIDRLINDVEEGRLLLPVSTEKLSKLTEPTDFKPEAGKPAWVRYYWL